MDMKTTSLPLSDQLLEAIEERIVTGAYPPGTRLDEVDLAKVFEVSRTPIREALIRLETMRIIEKVPRKGWVVTPISPQSLCEMFEFISELEALCGLFAARRATPFQIQQLLSAHEACRDVDDPDAYYRANEGFHKALYAAAGNSYLLEQLTEMQRRARPYRRLQLRAPERIKASFAEHEAIVAAVLARDEGAAAERLREHVMLQGDRFNRLLQSLEGFGRAGR
ncbi:GntR family transcriptional regulator [Rhizobium paknamense]|uniref:DNA-binding GntR family transcriptional regulator n=1 Tax=Rhizobium paknamense TaxID=1206817 RepID=A0ABU0IBS4_9HYPH|nr:GntR family transcriptional regulator [Rhizobium paknamense]MDQ0455665.1 DNA-binding GntR family transcriptional regulator [Rhizobium paknamense]